MSFGEDAIVSNERIEPVWGQRYLSNDTQMNHVSDDHCGNAGTCGGRSG